jgi:hypothetical protein
VEGPHFPEILFQQTRIAEGLRGSPFFAKREMERDLIAQVSVKPLAVSKTANAQPEGGEYFPHVTLP